jgi:hypothetical protein
MSGAVTSLRRRIRRHGVHIGRYLGFDITRNPQMSGVLGQVRLGFDGAMPSQEVELL